MGALMVTPGQLYFSGAIQTTEHQLYANYFRVQSNNLAYHPESGVTMVRKMLKWHSICLEEGVWGRSSVITDRSVHNQGIERLWRDVFFACLQLYRTLFVQLEENGQFDRNNEGHLMDLLLVYLPSFNRSLQQFVEQWKNHVVRTERLTPLQMFTQGVLTTGHFPHNHSTYGIDRDGPVPSLETDNVNVPISNIDLDEEAEQFIESMNVLEDDGQSGVRFYLECCMSLTDTYYRIKEILHQR